MHPLGAFAIAFVDYKDVSNLHDAGLNALHVIAHAGDEDHDGDIRQTHNINFVLSDAYGFDHDQIAACRIKDRANISRSSGQASQRTTGGHTADVDTGVGEVVLHADTITKNRSPGIGTSRVDGDNADA